MAETHPDPVDETVAAQPAPDLASGPGRWDWRSHVAALGLAMIVAGVFFALAPFIFDMDDDGAAVNLIVCAVVFAFLGVLRFAGVRTPIVGALAIVIGLWLFGSSFVIGDDPGEAWVPRVFGAMAVFLGVLGIGRPTGDPGRGAASADLR